MLASVRHAFASIRLSFRARELAQAMQRLAVAGPFAKPGGRLARKERKVVPKRDVRSAEVDRSIEQQKGRGLRGFVDWLGGFFPANSESEAVTTNIRLEASPEEVWAALRFYEDVPKRPGLFLLALLPRPIRSEGEKTRVGASVRCEYDGGHLVKRITVAEPRHLLRFEVLEQKLGIENSVSMGEGSYEIRRSEGGSEVLLTTHYRGHLRPRVLWRPFERTLAHHVHRHILVGMRTLLGAAPGERAGKKLPAISRGAPATGEPGSSVL
ncbi:MAG: SRPBCC family protein [Myxococcaceae bacterium]